MRKWIFMLLIFFLTSIVSAEFLPKEEAIYILQKIEAENYPNSDNIFISNVLYELDKNCLGKSVDIKLRKILTEQGRQNNFVFFYYDADYTVLDVNEIEIIKMI